MNHFKKDFMGKKKKAINVLTYFSISHSSRKNCVKTFLNLFVNDPPKSTD